MIDLLRGKRHSLVESARRHRDIYAALFESTAVGICIVDSERRIIDCNDEFCSIVRRPKDDIVGRRSDEITAGGEDPAQSQMERLVAGEIDRYTVEKQYVCGDGALRGRVSRRRRSVVTTTCTSPSSSILSERDEAERELRQRTTLLTHAQQIGGVGSWVFYPREGRDEWSPEAQRIFGFTDEEVERGDPQSFFDVIHPDDREWVMQDVFNAFETGDFSQVEYRIVRPPDGEVRWVREQAGVERGADGRPVRVLGVVLDVTERKAADDELRAQRELLERAQGAARLGSYSLDVRERRVTVSRELARVLGAGDEPFEISAARFSREFIHADDVLTHAVVAARAYREGGHHSFESRMCRPDGEVIWVRVHGTVEQDSLGLPERVIGFVQDVSDEHALEEQLRQAQKLDAVGQLAGGVAHDFNNLLTVIAGNAQLTLIDEDRATIEENTREILRATERAAELVRHLLAFSRAENAEPRILDLNAVVSSVRRMLDRLLEENIEIDVDLAAGRGGGPRRPEPARADPPEPRRQCARCDAGRWPPDRDDPGRRGLGEAHRQGRRPRHGRADQRPHLRSVLHDEAAWRRNRARALDRVRARCEGGRRDRRRLASGRGDGVRDHPAARVRGRRRRGGARGYRR